MCPRHRHSPLTFTHSANIPVPGHPYNAAPTGSCAVLGLSTAAGRGGAACPQDPFPHTATPLARSTCAVPGLSAATAEAAQPAPPRPIPSNTAPHTATPPARSACAVLGLGAAAAEAAQPAPKNSSIASSEGYNM